MSDLNTDSEEFKKGQVMLQKCGATVAVVNLPSGGKGLTIAIDEDAYRKAMTRNAGRSQSFISVGGHYKEMSVEDVRRHMKNDGIDETAAMLGISRRTLYRKLERAKRDGEDSM